MEHGGQFVIIVGTSEKFVLFADSLVLIADAEAALIDTSVPGGSGPIWLAGV